MITEGKWAPISDTDNEWVQTGDPRRRRHGQTYTQFHKKLPDWKTKPSRYGNGILVAFELDINLASVSAIKIMDFISNANNWPLHISDWIDLRLNSNSNQQGNEIIRTMVKDKENRFGLQNATGATQDRTAELCLDL